MYDFSGYIERDVSFWDRLLENGVYQCLYQWVILALLIAVLVFVILIFLTIKKKTDEHVWNMFSGVGSMPDTKIVFCKKCGNQCSVTDKVCPHCGTKRG